MTGSESVTVELFLASSDRSHHADELAHWSSAVGDLLTTADARLSWINGRGSTVRGRRWWSVRSLWSFRASSRCCSPWHFVDGAR